jgi:hypothetical protein
MADYIDLSRLSYKERTLLRPTLKVLEKADNFHKDIVSRESRTMNPSPDKRLSVNAIGNSQS